MILNRFPFVLLSAFAVIIAPTRADLDGTEAAVILDAPLVRTGVGAGTQTRGYTFSLDLPRTLTHLGLFSYNGEDAATVPRQIGVWDADGALVAELTIEVGGGEIEDLGSGSKFIFQALETPLILLPEVVYTVGVWYSLDAGTELPLGEDLVNPVDGATAGWESISENLPAEALGKMVVIEFRFESDELQNFAGWYLDDVVVSGR